MAGASTAIASAYLTDDQFGRAGKRLESSPIGFMEQAKQDWRDEDDADEQDLEQAVEAERAQRTVGDAAANEAADRQAAEVTRQNRRDRLRRIPEHEDELARPHDLVDEARGAGQDEERKDVWPDVHASSRREVAAG